MTARRKVSRAAPGAAVIAMLAVVPMSTPAWAGPLAIAPHEGGGQQVDVTVSLFGHVVAGDVYSVRADAPIDVGVVVADRGEASLRSVRVQIGTPDSAAATCSVGRNGAIALEYGQAANCGGRIVASSGAGTVPVTVSYQVPGESAPRTIFHTVPYQGVSPAVALTTTVGGEVPRAVLSFADGTPVTRTFRITAGSGSALKGLMVADQGLTPGSITCATVPGGAPSPQGALNTVPLLPAAGSVQCTGTGPAVNGLPQDCPSVTGMPAYPVLTAEGFVTLPAVSAHDACFLVDPPAAPVGFPPPPGRLGNAADLPKAGASGVAGSVPGSVPPGGAEPGRLTGRLSADARGHVPCAASAPVTATPSGDCVAQRPWASRSLSHRLAHTGTGMIWQLSAGAAALALGLLTMVAASRRSRHRADL